MTIDQMRAAIARQYPSRKWRERVEQMYDDQIVAIYYAWLERGYFKRKPGTSTSKPRPKGKLEIEQLTLDDLF